MTRELVEIKGDGGMRLNLHEGQRRAWESRARFVAVLAGTQGGKTSFGPHWFHREIVRCGPGDYLVATPTFPLLEVKALPEFKRLFERQLRLGRYVGSPVRRFEFSEAGARRTFGKRYDPDVVTNVYFGYAADPDSLESMTAKAAWLDEAGQKKFKLGSWQAILRRLSLAEGRALVTTTPYNLGWIKSELWDRWRAGDASVEVVRFESVRNPKFPKAEFERARRDLPAWKFDMFYRGLITRPAGLIYDKFSDAQVIPRFNLPGDWPRFMGLDFGGVNTAAMFYARDPSSGRLYAYREYHQGGKTAEGHARALLDGEPMVPECVGGAKSEGQWRLEFRAGGLPVRDPVVSDVEVGINRVYGFDARGELFVFDDLVQYLEQKRTYSRRLNDRDEPTEDIEDKQEFHLMDAERYILSLLADYGTGESATIEAEPVIDQGATRGW